MVITHPRRRGLSLPEAMISLVITSTLLVAVATAFNASAKAVQLNDGFFRCSQAGRVSLNQMLGEIRNCNSLLVDNSATPDTTWLKVWRPNVQTGATLNQLYVTAGNENYREFQFDAANQRVTLTIFYTDGTSSPVYELASNVTSCKFGPVSAADWGKDLNNNPIPIRVPISITVATGGNSVIMNGAASPRREIQY